MRILVTGANGFVGRNLIEQLKYIKNVEILAFDIDTAPDLLEQFCQTCDFVYHLAGVNRPEHQEDFRKGNFGFTSELLENLKKSENHCPVMLASSIQAELDNPYGKSKKEGEKLLLDYGRINDIKVLIYRFPNVFGKWCRPNYNSVVATFCYNVANDLPVQINGRDTKLSLVYIDDVVSELLQALEGKESRTYNGYCFVKTVHELTLGEIIDLLIGFKESRKTLQISDMTADSFTKKLYSTYLSYLPEADFKYPLKMNVDERGSFTEIIRTVDRGQFSVNISKPGIEKGNHWHNTKNEKFLVVSGKALIQFRQPKSNRIINYHVSGDKLEVVDIPVGYTHNIINEGETELITFMWCNECFDPAKPDTFFLKVNEE